MFKKKGNTVVMDEMKAGKAKKIAMWCGIALVAIIVLSSAFVVVPAGSSGVVVTLGKVSNTPFAEGLHLKAPFIQTVEIMSNKIQKIEVEAPAVSEDLQSISSSIAVNFRVGSQSAAYIYQNIGQDYQNIMLLPAVQESMKSVTAKYTAEELITARAQVGQEVKTTLEEKVSSYGIVIEKFNIVDFEFSAEFDAAIEAKQVAEQNLIKTKTEQEQAIVIAEAEAKKQVIAAEAEAEAILKKAEAQAEANRKVAASLNDELIEYSKVEKWNGELPVATGGNTFMDISGVTGE
ncbi:MAG: prohibitin family protein [Clostridia bacterium]|nr:prohibitin family protein [Clostridia bacterium]